jgi:hypothetical protein
MKVLQVNDQEVVSAVHAVDDAPVAPRDGGAVRRAFPEERVGLVPDDDGLERLVEDEAQREGREGQARHGTQESSVSEHGSDT